MIQLIIGASGFILLAGVAYVLNMLMLPELILFMVVLFPIFLYAKYKWNLYLRWSFSAMISVVCRFVFQYYLIVKGAVTELPIDLNNVLVRQFAGLGMVTGLFVWVVLLLGWAIHCAGIYYRDCVTIEDARNNRHIRQLSNLYGMTVVIAVIEVVSFIWIYKLSDMLLNMLIFIVALVCLRAVFTLYCSACCMRRCEKIYENQQESKKEESE